MKDYRKDIHMSVAVDTDALGKLLSLAKSLEEALQNQTDEKTIERVLIRKAPEGQLMFQVKGGMFWRFFTITLSGREQEYDLGQNFAQLQSLFRALSHHSDQEIRRAAQGMAMYGQTVIDTKDACVTLSALQTTLNSIIDLIKRKKLRRQIDEERKKSIVDALEAMKIQWRAPEPAVKASKPRREKKPQDKT